MNDASIDARIEIAIAEALNDSADARAAAMLRIASDPKGTKARLEELTATIKASDEARAAAEAVAAQVAADREAAESALASVRDERAAFDRHVAAAEKSLKIRTSDLVPQEEELGRRKTALDQREADLQVRIAEHDSVMRRLRDHVAEVL